MTAEQLPLVIENRQDTEETPSIAMSISEQRISCPVDAVTPRQAQILRSIDYAINVLGQPPTRRELLSMLGTTSQRRLHEALDELVAKGWLRVDDGVSRGIVLLVPASKAVVKAPRGPGLAKATARAVAARKVG